MNRLLARPLTTDSTTTSTIVKNRTFELFSQQHILIIIMIIAIILRLISALYHGDIVRPLPGVYDQTSYDLLARRVITGHGFSFAADHWPITPAGEPTAHWSYLYTLYLAAVYAITGGHPLAARILQAVLAGILHSWFAWKIGRRVGGPAVGTISALLSAVYIYFFYYAGALMTETFYIIGILWTLDCSLRFLAFTEQERQDNSSPKLRWRLWLELGLAIGITVLFRQVFLLFIPFLYLWIWWNLLGKRPPRIIDRLRTDALGLLSGTILSIVIVLVLVLPWTIRNYRAFDTFVLLNTNSGYAFFWGNHPIYGTRFVGILPSDGPSYQDLIPPDLRHLNEAELDRALLKEGLTFVFDEPVRYLRLSLSRTIEYFKFWPSEDSSLLSNISRVASFGILLPFMVYGLWRAGKRIGQPILPHQRTSIILLLLFVGCYTSIHLLTWALIRYRLPVDSVLVIFAAFGIVDLLQQFARTHKVSPVMAQASE